jgi:hypothetical protein
MKDVKLTVIWCMLVCPLLVSSFTRTFVTKVMLARTVTTRRTTAFLAPACNSCSNDRESCFGQLMRNIWQQLRMKPNENKLSAPPPRSITTINDYSPPDTASRRIQNDDSMMSIIAIRDDLLPRSSLVKQSSTDFQQSHEAAAKGKQKNHRK